MNKNVGSADKIIRIVLGVLIVAIGFYFQSWWGALGIILIATGLMNRCLLYKPFGISTQESPKTKI